MCLQCDANSIEILENFIDGFTLTQAQIPVEGVNGIIWDKGEYAIVQQNDPDIILSGLKEFPRDPLWNATEDFINGLADKDPLWVESLKFYDIVEKCDKHFKIYPLDGYRLVSACYKSGYDEEKDGCVISWVFNHIRNLLDEKEKNNG